MSANVIDKPVPTPSADSLEFFEGAKHGRLMVQRCADCGKHRFIARRRCDACGSARSAWVQASGRATLISYARVHQKFHPAFAAETPYPIATVELEEGPRLFTGLVGTEGKALRAGMPLHVVFEPAGPDWKIPKFRPA
ncbi:MAG: Zn-ribbon domain-containing OB-fold protein [SAR324 cluster bacterium]